MAYASWSVVYGEQPSAAKWNILGTNDASFNDGTGIADGAVTPPKWTNPYKFRARRVAAFSTSTSAFKKVTFDTEDFDTNNNFDVTTNIGRYTAPVAGFYQFNARLSVNGQNQSLIALYKNGSIYQRGSHQNVAQTVGVDYADTVQLAANDYVEIYVYTDTANAIEVTTGSQAYFSGFLVSET